MTRKGINAVLAGFVRSGALAEVHLFNAQEALLEFLDAQTDAHRLVAAEKAAREILKRNDLGNELSEIRRQVRSFELRRQILYGKQTDHSAHTVYVFLLGLWLEQNCASLQSALRELWPRRNGFILPWVLASLLHDIGYVFQGTRRADGPARRAIMKNFTPRGIITLLRAEGYDRKTGFGTLKRHLDELFRDRGFEPPPLATARTAPATLAALSSLPWAKELGLPDDAFEVLATCLRKGSTVQAESLRAYAYAVAESGYDGKSEGVVDHAVGSALLLLQWTTFWYWLVEQVRKADADLCERFFLSDPHIERNLRITYDVRYLGNEIVPAIFALACHNVLGLRNEGKRLLKFQLADDPLLYLSVLCDELQKWDRFPAGRTYLKELEDFVKQTPRTEELGLAVGENGIVQFTAPKAAVEKISANLDARLEGWRRCLVLRSRPEKPSAAQKQEQDLKKLLRMTEAKVDAGTARSATRRRAKSRPSGQRNRER